MIRGLAPGVFSSAFCKTISTSFSSIFSRISRCKTSFCLINIRQPFPDATPSAGVVHGRGGNSCGQVQGISAGYSDVYSASLDDQWIDVTTVADGDYWLEITADPENHIQETNESNNVTRVRITLDNGSVSSG